MRTTSGCASSSSRRSRSAKRRGQPFLNGAGGPRVSRFRCGPTASAALASARLDPLSQQPPPRKNAKPGYYPDPLATGRARWWDESGWTMRVGPVVPPDAPSGKPVAPPSKRCRHCGVESETFDSNCPNCGRGYGQSTGVTVAIVAAACAAAILLLGGCGLLIALGINAANDEIDKRSITKAEFNSIEAGQSEDSVRAELGKPTREKEFGRPPTRCIYYPQHEDGLFGLGEFRFCFQGGGLVRKIAD